MKALAILVLLGITSVAMAVPDRTRLEPAEYTVACRCYSEDVEEGNLFQTYATTKVGKANYLVRTPGNIERYLTPYEVRAGDYSTLAKAEAYAKNVSDRGRYASKDFEHRTPCQGIAFAQNGVVEEENVTEDVVNGKADFHDDPTIFFNNVSPLEERFDRIRFNGQELPKQRRRGFLTDCRVFETRRGTDRGIISRVAEAAAARRAPPRLPDPIPPGGGGQFFQPNPLLRRRMNQDNERILRQLKGNPLGPLVPAAPQPRAPGRLDNNGTHF